MIAVTEGPILTCAQPLSILGKPRPAVTWWKDFRMIDDSYTFVQSENVVKNVLEIEALTRSDALTGFTCKAANNNVTVAVSTSVIIDLNR